MIVTEPGFGYDNIFLRKLVCYLLSVMFNTGVKRGPLIFLDVFFKLLLFIYFLFSTLKKKSVFFCL